MAVDDAVTAHDSVCHVPYIVGTSRAPVSFHRLGYYLVNEIRARQAELQRVALGAQHGVVDERVARDRRAGHPNAELDCGAIRAVHLIAYRHQTGVHRGAAELPEQHQLHDVIG